MRKYKFGDANGAAGWLKKTNILYFVLAWNAFGICAYQWWKSRKVKEQKDWDKLSQAQKYMSFTIDPDDPIKVISISGFKVDSAKETSAGEYMQPKPLPPGKESLEKSPH